MSDRHPGTRATGALVGLAVAALYAIVGALVLTGCSQEGKLVQNQLPVKAVGADFAIIVHTDTTATINARFKVLVHVQNACEAQHNVLVLRLVGTAPPVYQITPEARYNADDKCALDLGGPRDTVLTLNVNGILFGKKGTTSGLSADIVDYVFQVQAVGAPTLTYVVDSLVTDFTPNTAQFDVRVEDATTGAVVPGATVAVDQLGPGGAATALDSLLTDSQGLADSIRVAAPADTAGAPNLPYRVRVALGARTAQLSVPSFPARLLRREKIVIRL